MVKIRIFQKKISQGVKLDARNTFYYGRELCYNKMYAEGAAVLFLPLEGILSDCGRGCACHVALRRNLLAETASKFWGLRQRVAYLTEPQLRRRILLFLRDRREAAGSDYFRVPYSRQEMAEVLGVNRSALSRELGRMQREGLLEFYRSSFRLKNV